MKKLFLTFSFLVALSCYTFAQTVTISGTVTDANGTALSAYPVWIVSDSTSGIVFAQTVLTNNNGIYSVSPNIGTATQGNFYVSTQDSCSGAFYNQTVSFTPSNLVFNNVDFTVCSVINPPSCQAGMWYQSSAMGYSFTGTASGGTAPYSYYWDFGDGGASTLQNPVYNYNTPGTFYPCLTITDATGCVAIYCDSLGIIVGGGGGGSMNCDVSFTTQTTAAGTTSFTSTVTNTTGAVQYYWDFGNGDTSSATNPTYSYNIPGLYLACLAIVDASGCTSMYCDTISVGGAGSNCSAMINYSASAMGVSASVNATGTAPFTYSWSFGNGTTSTAANPNIVYTTPGTYVICVSVTDANGCIATDCIPVTITSQTSGDLNVLVLSDSLTIPQAVVYLIQYDSVAGTLTAIQTDTAIQGYATFSNVPFGDYLVKAALLPSDPNFASYLPTYFQQSLTWSGATNVNLSPGMVGFTLIELIQGNNIGGGPGFIGGLVTQGANGPGDPFIGALVILYDANMNPIGYTYTDEDGEYSFDNLPYGVYYIYIEELGLQSAPIEVTLSPTTPSMDQVHFEIGSTYVLFTNTTSLEAVANMKVFPNPVTDQLYMQIDLDQMIDADISITSITGQVLQQRQTTLTAGNHLIDFETQELPVGVYTLQLRSNLGVITHKFVKQ